MTVAEFLEWESGDDGIYELVDGVPCPKHRALRDGVWMMAPPVPRHARIERNVVRAIDRQLKRSCEVLQNVGVVSRADEAAYRVPDVLVRCGPRINSPLLDDPRVVVEVLSPSTQAEDLSSKLDFYLAIPTVQDIVYVWQDKARANHWSRQAGGVWRLAPLIGDATVTLSADVGEAGAVVLSLAEIYADVGEGEGGVGG